MEIKTSKKQPFIGLLTSELFSKKETDTIDRVWSNILCSYLNELNYAVIDVSINDKIEQIFVNQGFVFNEQHLPYSNDCLIICWKQNDKKVLDLIQEKLIDYGLNDLCNKLCKEFESNMCEKSGESWYCSNKIWNLDYKSKSPEVIKVQLLKMLDENGIKVRYKKIWYWSEKYHIYLKRGMV